MCKIIYAYHGEKILVDDKDYEMLSHYRWHTRKGYALRNAGLNRKKSMVYDILGIESQKGMYVDHINGNTLDNRRANLRLVTPKENARNKAPHKDTSSKYVGVYLNKRGASRGAEHPWKWTITGSCATEEEAARERDRVAKFAFGSYTHLNFPE